MSNQTIPAEVSELKGVAKDVLHLLEVVLNARHYSSSVRRANCGERLSPQLIKLFSWVILVAELKAAKNTCPEVLEDLSVIKLGNVTTRGWSWRMVMEKALSLLEVDTVLCFAQPNPSVKRGQFLCIALTFNDGSSVCIDKLADLVQAAGNNSLSRICELGFESSTGKPDLFSVPGGEIAFFGTAQHWQALQALLMDACVV